MRNQYFAMILAMIAAALYAINIPLSKIYLTQLKPTMMAALLYLGAGIGLLIYALFIKIITQKKSANRLTRAELPYTIAMVVLDIIAPIFLMIGITQTTSANVSLINNFEIVATAIIALMLFKEKISLKLWVAIIMITIASLLLSYDGSSSLSFSYGSMFVMAACVCWGFENNCTRKLSSKNTIEIVTIKGCFSGLGCLIIALILNESLPSFNLMIQVMVLGFVAYGLSINCYILAQRTLKAAKTSAFYSITPFLGVAFSMLILKEQPTTQLLIALTIALISTILMISDTGAQAVKYQVHRHIHNHDGLKHNHIHIHVINRSSSHNHIH